MCLATVVLRCGVVGVSAVGCVYALVAVYAAVYALVAVLYVHPSLPRQNSTTVSACRCTSVSCGSHVMAGVVGGVRVWVVGGGGGEEGVDSCVGGTRCVCGF